MWVKISLVGEGLKKQGVIQLLKVELLENG
jgi:hypothetical protein